MLLTRTILLLSALLIGSLVWGQAPQGQSLKPAGLVYPVGADAIPILREVWEVGVESLYPEHLAGRFSAEKLEELERQLSADGGRPLADVLNPFLESLGVSHTLFYDARHQTYYLLRSLFSTQDLDTPTLYTIGVHLDEYEPGLINAVMEGSPAHVAGVLRGDRIVAVRAEKFASLLQWQQSEAVELVLQRQGEAIRIALTPVRQSLHRALANATSASWRVAQCGEYRVGYLHLWSGTHPVFLEILWDRVAAARAMQLDGFVLDLRDGYGGAWWPYLDPFHADRRGYFAYATRDAEGTSDTLLAESATMSDAWLGPMAVLINSGTRSGKESLAFQFKKTGRAPLFGTTTAGAFTAGRGVFADRAANYLFYLSVREFLLDGEAIEGEGVSPDVTVEDGAGYDAPLAAALDDLGRRLGRAEGCDGR